MIYIYIYISYIIYVYIYIYMYVCIYVHTYVCMHSGNNSAFFLKVESTCNKRKIMTKYIINVVCTYNP